MSGIAFTLQLGLALLFGAAIGAERQWRQRTAGLRTNALVSSGAAMFVLGGRLMGAPTDSVLRVAAQVVSGIGFLGGGLIFRRGPERPGLEYGRDSLVLGGGRHALRRRVDAHTDDVQQPPASPLVAARGAASGRRCEGADPQDQEVIVMGPPHDRQR